MGHLTLFLATQSFWLVFSRPNVSLTSKVKFYVSLVKPHKISPARCTAVKCTTAWYTALKCTAVRERSTTTSGVYCFQSLFKFDNICVTIEVAQVSRRDHLCCPRLINEYKTVLCAHFLDIALTSERLVSFSLKFIWKRNSFLTFILNTRFEFTHKYICDTAFTFCETLEAAFLVSNEEA